MDNGLTTDASLTGPARAVRGGALSGRAQAPGDKSMSHRALIFGALAAGETAVSGLLEAEDVLCTADALRALGAEISKQDGIWRVRGAGGLSQPDGVLDCGNSGTGCRLLMGAVAGFPIKARFTGDESLRGRPMGRVLGPLSDMGVVVDSTEGRLPALVQGVERPTGIDYVLPKPSAQVKSAILLAGLGADGVTRVTEPEPTRDHTERMLSAFGVDVDVEDLPDGARIVSLKGGQVLTPARVDIPSDPSSAAFPVVAALITPGSDVTAEGVLLNPLRAGLYETLREMGADITFENERAAGGERVADVRARFSKLKPAQPPAARAPSMIDEYPILAVAAACAGGQSVFEGLAELRVKESDRLGAVAAGLKACGVAVEEGADWLRVIGTGAAPRGGGRIATHMDHRIAMAFLTLGLASETPVEIDAADMIATSFPNFFQLMTGLGADIQETS